MNIEIDYVIIGAGMAGLTAGYELKKQNKDFIILEKESHPGGRASTKILDEVNFDYGAAFIFGSYKELFKIIEELNIKVERQEKYASKIGIVYKNKIHPLNSNLVSLFRFDLISLKSKFKAITKLPLLIKDLFSSNIDDENLNIYLKRNLNKDFVKYLVDPVTNNLFFYNTESFSKSLLYKLINYVKTDTTYYNFEKGINQVSNELSKILPIEFNSETISVVKVGNKVEVKYINNGEHKKYVANKVIIATPGDHVHKILTNPDNLEHKFFSKVKYSSTVKVLCSTEEDLFSKYDRIFFVESKKQLLTSANFVKKVDNKYYFTVGINSDISKELIKNNKVSEELVKSLISDNLKFVKEFNIVDISKWNSAIPKFDEKYVKSMHEFLYGLTQDENRKIFYAGDYLFGPFIEGAVNSGLNAVKNIEAFN